MSKPRKGVTTTALVLGITSGALSPIPILNNAGVISGILAIGFAVFGLFGLRKGTAITSLALAVAGVVVSLVLQVHWTHQIDDRMTELDKAIATLDQLQP